MPSLSDAIDAAARSAGFSGVVRVERGGVVEVSTAYGLADRGHEIPNTVDTQFAIASGTKALTALTVMRLVEQRTLSLGTTARSLLGADLPLVAGDVTIEQLLAHRSGIGDYFDEDLITDILDYAMPVPVHELASTEQYLAVLDGHATAFPAGSGFAYNNGGYVVLALLAERAAGIAFYELVESLVCRPAGMPDTTFLRSDELPGRAALGYLTAAGLRTNVFHLPVRGSGDGGIYTTATDLHTLWSAFFGARIVTEQTRRAMVAAHSDWPQESRRYGLGFHLDATGEGVFLEGSDAGVSFLSRHDPARETTYTVIANWTDGAWPMAKLLAARFAPG